MAGVGPLANEAWEAMFRAQATLTREFEYEGDWGDFPPREYGVLYALAGAENGLRITDLVDDVLLTRAGVSRLVTRLEKRGLVERRPDPDHVCRIGLTTEGSEAQRRLGHAHARHVTNVMTRALTRQQLQTRPPHEDIREGHRMNDLTPAARSATIAVVNAGVSDPSSTRLLADRVAQKTVDTLHASGTTPTVRSIDLGPLATDTTQGIVSGRLNPKVQSAMELLASADAVIAATPVYKAGISGLFKSFADLIDNDLLIARPVVLAATGGSARHAKAVDEQLRPLFAFLRAIPMPTSLYAAPENWAATDLGKRITRAAQELSVMLRSGAGRQIADSNWGGYQHQFGGNATRAQRSVDHFPDGCNGILTGSVTDPRTVTEP